MTKSTHAVMLILVLCVLQSALANMFSSSSHADECSLLFQFKENMSINKSASVDTHAYPKVASWNLNRSDGARNCCSWDGVECRFGHVIGLDLSSSFLYGPFSSNNTLFNLIHLRTLNLADNDFCSSQIPSGIGRLSQLANLNLSSCFFSGEVPKQISQLRNLASLDLTGNGFHALKLQSSAFQNLIKNSSETLRELFLSEVNIDSELPTSMGNLTHLNILKLSNCGLTGTLHASISNLTKLRVLDLGNNFFSGPIPLGIFNLQTLQLLDVHCNYQLTGYFPEFHGNSELKQLIMALTNFQGSIPASIENLTHLNTLDLGSCPFAGTLPASVSKLSQLTFLDLSGVGYTGSLPSLENFSNLTYLSLSYNNFDRWKLPDWFGKLNKITYLNLENVNLYGEIPSSFFNLTEVRTLVLSSNQLIGQLPSSLLNHQNLESFYLDGNNVTVDFYRFLSLKNLNYLNLCGNNITLSVTDSHRNETQAQFKALWLTSCNLKVFPEFLRFQHQLEFLYLDNNRIEGLIPEWMWNISKETLIELRLSQNLLLGFEQHSPVAPWVNLMILDLSHNMLHGSIPMPPPLTYSFSVLNNKLTGEIPSSICDLIYLESLDLSFNSITGSIPPCLEKLSDSNLVVLNLRSNTLQGSIPNIFTNESKLEMIDLSSNKLEGKVPRSLANCKSLQFLNLGYNFIKDRFPVWLGALPELQVLILRFNKFHGIIKVPSKIKVSFPKLRIIDLSYNSFSGDLPHHYFQLWSAMKETRVNATYMDVERLVAYQFLFSVQMTNKGVKMEYAKIINTFSAVDLSSNMFRGKIPESIKTLIGLRLLNLSNNELSGAIPPFMGKLIYLEALDLSSNKLSGIIPQDLVQLNFLGFLNVSNNNLTGRIPQGRQFNTFSNNSYMVNQALCGLPLSMKCGDSKAPKPPKVSLEEDTESDFPNEIDWVVILIGLVSGLVIGLVCGDHLSTRYYNWFVRRFRK